MKFCVLWIPVNYYNLMIINNMFYKEIIFRKKCEFNTYFTKITIKSI